MFFGLVSFVAIADHTSALVLLFGVLVPAAALLAHSRRFREAQSPELRQLYRLLGVAMGVSLVGAVAVLTVTSVLKSSDERFTETTRDYELVAPAAGTYIFYCDPHTDGHGGDRHRRGADRRQTTARGSCRSRPTAAEFDKDSFELVAGQTSVIRFTNTDGTEHNVSIYPDPEPARRRVRRASCSRARTWPPSRSGCSGSCSPSSRSRSSSRSCATTCGTSTGS